MVPRRSEPGRWQIITAGAERLKPDAQISPAACVNLAMAHERGEGGKLSDVAQDWVSALGTDVLSVGIDERVALGRQEVLTNLIVTG